MNFHVVVVFVTNHTTLFKVGFSVLWGVNIALTLEIEERSGNKRKYQEFPI